MRIYKAPVKNMQIHGHENYVLRCDSQLVINCILRGNIIAHCKKNSRADILCLAFRIPLEF